MPNVLLPVPHFEQSRDGSCLPVCVQMVLNHLGDARTEADFSKILGTKAYGTPIRNAKRLREDGYDVEVRQLTRTDLESYIESGLPVIVRVWTLMLGYWNVTTSHVVVVVGYDDNSVFINDPAISNAPQQVVWDAFLAAWAEYDETAVIVSKP
jgi:ABC-type bacteriocin/lantibiotic exporter with double-glycine peptidase domain